MVTCEFMDTESALSVPPSSVRNAAAAAGGLGQTAPLERVERCRPQRGNLPPDKMPHALKAPAP